MIEINGRRYSFPKILTFGFLLVIMLGTAMLLLSFATRPGLHTSFMTAFFTSTSATCVTGLTLVSTAGHWTPFGQVVIAVLMEVGGLGFMTFAVMMSLMIRRRMRMSTRLLTQEALNLDHLSQLSVVYLIIRLSILIQLVGAVFLFFDFYPRYGLLRGIWYSIFHAISAFCNAGFDLFGNSMENYVNDPYMLCVLMVLIVAGSFGFLVWKDILGYHRYHHLSPAHPIGVADRIRVVHFIVFGLPDYRAQPGPAEQHLVESPAPAEHDLHGSNAPDSRADHLPVHETERGWVELHDYPNVHRGDAGIDGRWG